MADALGFYRKFPISNTPPRQHASCIHLLVLEQRAPSRFLRFLLFLLLLALRVVVSLLPASKAGDLRAVLVLLLCRQCKWGILPISISTLAAFLPDESSDNVAESPILFFHRIQLDDEWCDVPITTDRGYQCDTSSVVILS